MTGERATKAILLREQGMTFADIGKELGVSRIRAFQLVKDAANKPSPGSSPIPNKNLAQPPSLPTSNCCVNAVLKLLLFRRSESSLFFSPSLIRTDHFLSSSAV